MQKVIERIRLLSPVHQQDVYSVVAGVPTLKHQFQVDNEAERSSHLSDFERYAGYTIPSAFPPEGTVGSEEVQYDFQSLGAQLVENLTNKIMLALFHPSRPFFKIEEDSVESTTSSGELQKELSEIEKKGIREFAKKGGRVACTGAVQQLVITGNTLLHMPANEQYRYFSFRDYNAKWDSFNKLVSCILREEKDVVTLEDDIASVVMARGKKKTDTVSVYTGIIRIKMGYYLVWQEVEDYEILSDRYGVYSEETLPYRPQRWNVMPNRQAGVGVVENMSGDFHMLSSLAATDIDIMALITDVKTLVNPSPRTKLENLVNSPSGAYVPGHKDDIHSHVHNIGTQATYVDTKTQQVAARLGQVFLMTSSMIRDAERVTAEEIRLIAQQLDQAHAGPYGRVARSLQEPIARDLVATVAPQYSKAAISIITGLESVSRLSELDSVRGFLADMQAVTNVPPVLLGWLNLQAIANKFASGWGVAGDNLVFSEKEKAANDEQMIKLQGVAEAAAERGRTLGAQ
jgi:hypothetical protein